MIEQINQIRLIDKYKQILLRTTVIDEYREDCLIMLLNGEINQKEYDKMILKANQKEEQLWKNMN